MPIEVIMPALSPTMNDGKLLSWQVKEGDALDTSKIIAEIETDKAVMELEAPGKGILSKIIVQSGNEQIKVGTLIAVIAKKNETALDVENFIKNFTNGNTTTNISEVAEIQTCENRQKQESEKSNLTIENQNNQEEENKEKLKISPLAKKILTDNNVSLNSITQSLGSGPGGRIVKEDVEKFLENKISNNSHNQGIFNNIVNRNINPHNEILNSSMRKAIATKLTQSKQNIPHFYISFDVEMDNVCSLREGLNKALNQDNLEKPKYKISINDIITKATALAIKKNPKINSSWQGEKIHQYNNIDICIAVALDNGLITPIVKNCDQKGIVAISEEIKDLAKKAKEGKLKAEEYQGGGFTISNLGNYSVVSSFTAIVNPPQSAILSVASIQEKAIVKNSKIEIKKVCQMQISADHRALDGADVAKFANDIKNIIEEQSLTLII